MLGSDSITISGLNLQNVFEIDLMSADLLDLGERSPESLKRDRRSRLMSPSSLPRDEPFTNGSLIYYWRYVFETSLFF